MEITVSLISMLLIITGIVGTIIPALPGLFLCLIGLLVHQFWGYGPGISVLYIWIFIFLTLLSTVLGYVIPLRLTKKYGGTNWGNTGGIIGTLLGFFIPIPLGFLFGMFIGVFVGELLHDSNDTDKAFKSVKGTFIGFLYSTTFNFLIGLAILFTVFIDFLQDFF